MSTVLVVDDDELLVDILRAAFERAGLDVVGHRSGFGLASAVRAHRPAVILLDVNMPGLTGPNAIRVMQALDATYCVHAPVVLHSGSSEAELAELAREVGAVGWIRKPATIRDVLAAVSSAIAAAPRAAP